METDATEVKAYTHVALRIFGPNLLPEEVTKNLQIMPDHAHHLGDFPRDDPKYSSYKHGMWLLRSKISEDQALESHLDSLLSILASKQLYVRSLTQHGVVDFSCYLYAQSGFQLSPQILRRIADLGATLGVAIVGEVEESLLSIIYPDSY